MLLITMGRMKTIMLCIAAGYMALIAEGYLGFSRIEIVEPTITLVAPPEPIR